VEEIRKGIHFVVEEQSLPAIAQLSGAKEAPGRYGNLIPTLLPSSM
jgi:hypothetical protein